jgi:hypothetical protein
LKDKRGNVFESFHIKAKSEDVNHLKEIHVDGTITMSHPAVVASFEKAGYLAMFRMIG